MDWIIITSTVVSAIATCFIAWFSYASTKLAKEIQKENEISKKEQNDLYQAIVIATLLSSNTSPTQFKSFKTEFEKHYHGETIIFKETVDTK